MSEDRNKVLTAAERACCEAVLDYARDPRHDGAILVAADALRAEREEAARPKWRVTEMNVVGARNGCRFARFINGAEVESYSIIGLPGKAFTDTEALAMMDALRKERGE